jgi:5-methylcytosine-specific restriction endonuclease McrA
MKRVYRARRRAGGGSLSIAEWREILAAYAHRCAYCGKVGAPLERDHVLPIARGGKTTKDNIVPSCRSCNARKGRSLLSALPSDFFRPTEVC